MKIFETIHSLLIFILALGVPGAATTMPSGQPFSPAQALKQMVLTTAIILVLLVLNFLLARLFSSRRSTAKSVCD
ncbi:MAG TPA: hypothetical protein VF656_08725 [Pyrinomonadaceae bacterium]|jgi:VIT1/CCC1 family predicted Fe2+/Mn2+ transporter